MARVDKAALFGQRLEEDEIEIKGFGTVLVRAMSRAEAAGLSGLVDNVAREAYIISTAMVDPKMTKADVRDWMAAAPAGQLEAISHRIGELSGLIESSEKDAYKSDGSESGT